MVGMGVREHDRGRQQAPETIPPVEAAVDHHLAAAVPDEQGAVPAMPARSRLDLAPRSEKAKPHRPRWAPRPASPSVSETSPARDEPRHSSTAATSVASPGTPVVIELDRETVLVEHSRLRAAAAQEARQARTLGAAVDPDQLLGHWVFESCFICSSDIPARSSCAAIR